MGQRNDAGFPLKTSWTHSYVETFMHYTQNVQDPNPEADPERTLLLK